MRTSISLAWQLCGVCSTSGGFLNAGFRIGYSRVTGAPSGAFFSARLGQNSLRWLPSVTYTTWRNRTMSTSAIDPQTFSIGVLFLRVVIGLVKAAHGSQKLFGWFGGYGLRGTGSFFEQLGFRPGTPFAAAASATEVVSGLLVAIGFLGPI